MTNSIAWSAGPGWRKMTLRAESPPYRLQPDFAPIASFQAADLFPPESRAFDPGYRMTGLWPSSPRFNHTRKGEAFQKEIVKRSSICEERAVPARLLTTKQR